MLVDVKVRERGRAAIRRASVPLRLRPSFLVIGAQKCGTTSLHRYLAEHPQACCATPKEVHYFNVHYHYGDTWYLAHFPLRSNVATGKRNGPRAAVGEFTPDYLFHPTAAERVHAFDPQLKLVVLLRDPVERAYSQYQMQVRKRGETRSFEEALALEETEFPAELERFRADPMFVSPTGRRRSYVARGRYAEQLERWLALFPREQLLVLASEELWRDPARVTRALTAFLGIPEWTPKVFPRQSAGRHAPQGSAVRERLAEIFEPHNRRLEELLGRRFPWARPSVRARPRERVSAA